MTADPHGATGPAARLRRALIRNPSVPVAVAVIAAFLLSPALETNMWGRRALDALLLGSGALAVLACRPRRRLLDVAAGLAAFGLVAGALLDVDPSTTLGVARALLGGVLASLGAAMLAREVHRSRLVTLDTVAGAGAAFLLLAVAWADIWGVVRWIQPWSLVVIHPAAAQISEWAPSTLMQHSLMVLTTLNDQVVVATTPLSRSLTALQGFMGMGSLIVLVARLVAVHALARPRAVQQPGRQGARRPPVQLTLVRGEQDGGPESDGGKP